MLALKDILKAVAPKEKVERKQTLIAVAEEQINWNLQDKSEIMYHLPLTKYQLYWLKWRIIVHLRCYNQFEWSEMKDVLEIILKQLEGEWEKCHQPSIDAPIASPTIPQTQPSPVDTVCITSGTS